MRNRIIELILFLVLNSNAIAVDVKVSDKIYPVKYKIGEIKVYSDEERGRMTALSVDTGTGSLKPADFVSEIISPVEQEIINELNAEGNFGSRSEVLNEISRRLSNSYNLDKLVNVQKEITALNQIKADNPLIDITSKNQKLTAEYNLYKSRIK